jgi:uroporphyrinogen-III synthase
MNTAGRKALVTRPAENAGSLAEKLAARGLEPLLEPLLAIRLADDAQPQLAKNLPGAQALLFTSANGTRAFATASAERALPVFAVGDATSRAAREAGFTHVESAQGDVHALARLAASRLAPQGGALLHAAAREVAGDLGGALAKSGFEVRRVRLYEAVAASRLSDRAWEAIAAGEVGCALFFSPRTAETFVRLARGAGLAESLGGASAIGLSPAVTAALGGIKWRILAAARTPNEAALLAALDTAMGET